MRATTITTNQAFLLNGIGFSEKNIVSKWKHLYKLDLSSPLCVKSLGMNILDTSLPKKNILDTCDLIGEIVSLSKKVYFLYTAAKSTLSHG